MAERKSVAKGVIFSILTCGLYLLYWMAKVNDGVLDLNDEDGTSGFTVIILNILTCGIYGVYWAYKSGRRMTTAQERYGMRANDNSILFTVISIFIGNLLVVAILQSDINETLDFIELGNQGDRFEENHRSRSKDSGENISKEEDIVDEVGISQLDGQVNILDEMEDELTSDIDMEGLDEEKIDEENEE